MIEQITGLIIHFIEATKYLGIFVLMTLESALIPIPSEVTMPFSGFLVEQGKLNFWLVALTGTLGNLVGSWIAYLIGFYLEEHLIIKWIKKWGKFLLLTEHDYLKAVSWLQRYGDAVTLFSRVLPAVRTFISLPAGLSEMSFKKFSFYTFIGSFIWSLVLTFVGVKFGSNWHVLEPYFRKFQIGIVILLLIFFVWYMNHKLKIIKF